MNICTVHASPVPPSSSAPKGWDLRIDDVEAHVHVRSLAKVPAQARAFAASVSSHEDRDTRDRDGIQVNIVLEGLDGLDQQARESRRAAQEAAEALEAASRRTREIARALRDKGLSVTDTAVVLGVSQARASQLLNS